MSQLEKTRLCDSPKQSSNTQPINTLNHLQTTGHRKQITERKSVPLTAALEKLRQRRKRECSPSACRETSVSRGQPPMLRSRRCGQCCDSATTASSVSATQRRKYTTCRYGHPCARDRTPATAREGCVASCLVHH
jgi:hypothetical protein